MFGNKHRAGDIFTKMSWLAMLFFVVCRNFDCAIEEWGRFHCDLKDLTQWLTETETLLSESVAPDGQLDLESAQRHQEVSEGGCEIRVVQHYFLMCWSSFTQENMIFNCLCIYLNSECFDNI